MENASREPLIVQDKVVGWVPRHIEPRHWVWPGIFCCGWLSRLVDSTPPTGHHRHMVNIALPMPVSSTAY